MSLSASDEAVRDAKWNKMRAVSRQEAVKMLYCWVKQGAVSCAVFSALLLDLFGEVEEGEEE